MPCRPRARLGTRRLSLPFEIDAITERRDYLELQATYVQAASLNGALFQLGLAASLTECDDAAPAIGRRIASAANVLISMGGEVVNQWADPTDPTYRFDGRAEAVIADAAESALAAA